MSSDGSSKWTCHHCTFENFASARRCTMCRSVRVQVIQESPVASAASGDAGGLPFKPAAAPKTRAKAKASSQQAADIYRLGGNKNPRSPSPLQQQPQAASTSTYSQQVDLCDIQQQQQQQQQQQHQGKWSCHMCTYLNWPRAAKCTQCLTVRTRQKTSSSLSPPQRTSPSSPSPAASSHAMDGGSSSSGFYNTSYVSSPNHISLDQMRISQQQDNNERNSNRSQLLPIVSDPSPPPPAPSSSHPLSPTTSSSSSDQHQLSQASASPASPSPAQRNPSRSSSSSGGGGGGNCNLKWSCSVCTYENWPRSRSCVLCGSRPPHSEHLQQLQQQQASGRSCSNRDSPSPPAAAAAAAAAVLSNEQEQRSLSPFVLEEGGPSSSTSAASASTNNYDYERRVRQLRRRMREADWTWLTACMGVVEGDMNPVEAYLNGGGDPTRKLTNPEVALLNSKGNVYEAGHTLVHLAIRFHREDMLATLISQFENCGSMSGGIKCVPSYVAPDLASAIRRHIAQSLRQRKGYFPCYFFNEWATYSLPPEIEDLPSWTQEQLFSELLDRDAQKELEEDGGAIINWSDEICLRLGSRLHALWNRSAGDCLLDSVLQATWGVFDRDGALRRAMADSLREAGQMFFPRWKEWETHQALQLDYSLHDSQLAGDWSGLLGLASQPGASLEQLHVFCLAHVLRRPIIVYGVKYVKSWRGENLGYARFEGVYLPLLWESTFCSRSPIALGYTRGHFCALVPPEATASCSGQLGGSVGVGGGASSSGAANHSLDAKSTVLPLMTCDRKLLPIHFVSQSELGQEESILRQWLDVGVTEAGLLVAQQKVTAKPPLLVAQMTEEWLNHYRKLAQTSVAPFSSRGHSVSSHHHPTASLHHHHNQNHHHNNHVTSASHLLKLHHQRTSVASGGGGAAVPSGPGSSRAGGAGPAGSAGGVSVSVSAAGGVSPGAIVPVAAPSGGAKTSNVLAPSNNINNNNNNNNSNNNQGYSSDGDSDDE